MVTIIHMLNGNNSEIELHYKMKEYRDDIIVEIDSKYYEVYFYTAERMAEELVDDIYFSFPGLIILANISNKEIVYAIKGLCDTSFFEKMHAYNYLPINDRFINNYYRNEIVFNAKDIFSFPLE